MKKKKQTKKQSKQKITARMTFAQVVSKYPKTTSVFLKHGMHCIGCPMAMQETVGEGAAAHGINVKKLVDELNKITK